ncbi:TatD family hydrolase [Idiomarina sp.]|uniref:TatD family hydrolase n=1 Tax=Idiomarina sp. TaxID=1874361 RepID=UPI0025C4FDE2|nr:TatD family hydrolase [Idiomarina sp.]
MQLFDSHCHLDFDVFDEDRGLVIENARAAAVEKFMLLGVCASQWSKLISMAGSIDGGYYALGLHPYFIQQHHAEHIDELIAQLDRCGNDPRLRAVGEIGLDAECADMDLQLVLLREQLRLAKDARLPVILHHRKTLDKLLKLVRESGPERGVIHAFSGSYEQGRAWVDQGYYLGIGGTITYPRANKTRDAIKRLPLDAMVLETDSPDMPMCGYQGQRNEPARLVDALAALAELKQCEQAEVASITYTNTKRLFSL